MSPGFAHLHVHTEYSILDGACRVKDALAAARAMGMESLAITDHGVMYGTLSFYKEALKAGIKPILGAEVYFTCKDRRLKEGGLDDRTYHLVLLAQNNEGYRNLMRIVTRGFLEGFYYKPRVDIEVLAEHREGLIALSACLKGEVQYHLMSDDREAAVEAARKYAALFGQGNFFLEIMDHGIPEQKKVNELLVPLASEMGLGLVATNDVHYVRRQDAKPHDHLLCIQTGKMLNDPSRLKFSSDEFYLKSPEEMASLFPDFGEALSNTAEIAERCEVEIPLNKVYLPTYKPPDGYDLDSYLRHLAEEGVRRRYGDDPGPEVVERLDHELSVIASLGFSGYFLIVWDFVRHSKELGIKVGPGRGSAAGSLVAYALDITAIDPLKYGLLFERFLNAERIALPDIDIDFSHFRRGEVIEYVSDKYGRDRVSPIVTFSRLKAKAAVKDVGRVKDVDFPRMDALTKLIPEDPKMTIDLALEQSGELAIAYDTDSEVREIIDTARGLEGMVRHASVHAAGVVIAADAIDSYAPLSIQQKTGENSTLITTQYDMYDVESLGLLKVDMLGLKTQSLLELAVQMIENRRGEAFDLDDLPMDDEKTFRLIQQSRTVGTFQLASPGMRGLMRDMVPNRFEDIIALIALFRPGPLGQNMHKTFVDNKHGRKKVAYPHPLLREVLSETYGVIVYQEQAMQVARTLAGYTGLEADELRKAIGKKQADIMERHREKFVTGAVKNGVDEASARRVFDLIETFGGYGFNKSHSTAYALVSYQTAYLKAHFPEEYMAALMTIYMDNGDRLVEYINECRVMGLAVRPPDINVSEGNFTPGQGTVLFGLSAVRNVGSAVVDLIVASRKEGGPFASFDDFCDRVPPSALNKKTIESLLKAGAFDSLEPDRSRLLSTYDHAVCAAQRRRKDRETGQFTLFGDGQGEEQLDEARHIEVIEIPRRKLLAFEKEMLGVYVSDHPLSDSREEIAALTDVEIAGISPEMDRSTKTVGGLIAKVERRFNKSGRQWAVITLEDFSGSIDVLVFANRFEEMSEMLVEDAVVLVRGRFDLKDNSRKVLAEEIKPLPRGSRAPECLVLSLDASRFTEEMIAHIKEVLMEYPGEIPVHLRLHDNGAEAQIVRLGDLYSISTGGDLIARLKALLGESAVSLKYQEI